MTDQTTAAERTSATTMSPQEALVSLLIGGARADGSVSAHEANQIEHVVAAMKLFRGDSHEMRQTIFNDAAERIRERGTEGVIDAAAAALPKELGATAFAVTVDLMLSDGGLTANELRFAEGLCGLLNVDREMAARIVDVLTIKNAG